MRALWWLLMLTVTTMCGAGCGGAPASSLGPLGSQEIADILDGQGGGNDPHRQVEVALGEFHVTHDTPVEYELITVRFKAFAVVQQAKQDETGKLVAGVQQRLRDAILRVVKETDYTALHDPSLAHLRSEISLVVNQTIRRNHVRGIVFSDFTIDKG